jgi:ATP-dependent DNA helicase RecG
MPDIAQTPVSSLHGVGPRMAAKLSEAGIERIEDLLFHLPLRYQDRTRITPLGAVQPGADVVVEGEIRVADVAFGRRRSLLCRIQDSTGTLSLRFFHFSAAQKRQFEPGRRLRCFGEVRRGASGLEMYHPEYRLVDESQPVPVEESLTPVYPGSSGVSQATWRKLCSQALQLLARSAPPDLLPGSDNFGMSLIDALDYLHAPPPDAPQELIRDSRHPAQLRLALEELVAHNLSLDKLRRQQQARGAQPLDRGQQALREFVESLPFEMTAAQTRVVNEILNDLSRPLPMLRLLQGDVGSGKTVVAACAARQAIASGVQVAVMAPTEILAEQHRASFAAWFEPLGITPCLLTGRSKGNTRRNLLELIASGQAQLVIGTHALFQNDVAFSRLGLVVVDEQHRFGVHQRLRLTEKGEQPHQLVMTATPIPRTLSMVAYADLDCSIIDELPPGRQPVQTVLISDSRREQVIERVRAACSGGRQAYWVCTLIEESEALEAQAAEATSSELTSLLPGLSVGLVHGRLKPSEKEAVMQRFKAGDIDLLVATTVIEVGVDVANASLMIIENPERLGLAQLHQLRGRVGRGAEASHCVLLFKSPLSNQSQARLTSMRESNDGFYIAERDLELRGPGEVLGTRQTGLMDFRVADIQLHGDLLDRVRQLALELAEREPERVEALIRRWLGNAERFASV